MPAALHRFVAGLGVEALRFEKIRVHEAGEQHPDQEGLGEAFVRGARREAACRREHGGRRQQARERLPSGRRHGLPLLQASFEIGAVRQPGVMARDDEGEHLADRLRKPGRGDLRARRRMIAAAAPLALDVSLELRRELADVVQIACNPGRLRPPERLREVGRAFAHGREVIRQQFPIRPARIVRRMREIQVHLPRLRSPYVQNNGCQARWAPSAAGNAWAVRARTVSAAHAVVVIRIAPAGFSRSSLTAPSSASISSNRGPTVRSRRSPRSACPRAAPSHTPRRRSAFGRADPAGGRGLVRAGRDALARGRRQPNPTSGCQR